MKTLNNIAPVLALVLMFGMLYPIVKSGAAMRENITKIVLKNNRNSAVKEVRETKSLTQCVETYLAKL